MNLFQIDVPGTDPRAAETLVRALAETPTDAGGILAGHAGACAKVTTATITGRTDVPCTCRTEGEA